MATTLDEITRRNIFAPAVPGLPTGFAPQPITMRPYGQFAPPAPPPVAPTQLGGMAGGDGGMVGGDGGEVAAPMGGAPGGFQFDNQQIQTPFGIITTADLVGKAANVISPLTFQLLSLALTGKTIGTNVKGALTPVVTATPVPVGQPSVNLNGPFDVPVNPSATLAFGGVQPIDPSTFGAVPLSQTPFGPMGGFGVAPSGATSFGVDPGFSLAPAIDPSTFGAIDASVGGGTVSAGDASAGVTGPGMGVE